jgi:hypothetical protein
MKRPRAVLSRAFETDLGRGENPRSIEGTQIHASKEKIEEKS